MKTGKALNGKPYAGNSHVRFDEGDVASAATPRRGSLLYKVLKKGKFGRGARSLVAICAAVASLPSLATVYTWTGGDAENPTLFSKTANWDANGIPSTSETNEEIKFPLSAAVTIVNDIGDIAVTKISFSGAYKATVLSPGGYKFTEVQTIANSASVNHEFQCKVICKSGITPNIARTSATRPAFPGGIVMDKLPITGSSSQDVWSGNIETTTEDLQEFANASMTGSMTWLLSGTTFRAKYATLDRIGMSAGATSVVERLLYYGCKRGANNGWYSQVWDNGNGVVKTEELRVTGDATLMHSYAAADEIGGTIIAKRLVYGVTKIPGGNWKWPRFFLNCGGISGSNIVAGDANGEGFWVIGSGGLDFTAEKTTGHYSVRLMKTLSDNKPGAMLQSYEDWALAENPNGRDVTAFEIYGDNTSVTAVAIDTAHYAIGDATLDAATKHTVTLNGMITGGGAMRLYGPGEVVFANAHKVSGGVTANDSVTVVCNAGCRPGNGTVTMNGTSTLKVAESSEVSLGGALTLASGAMLAFNFTEKDTAPVLNGTAVTVPSGSVNVKVSSTGELRPKGGNYALTSGMNFSGMSVNLVDPPEWTKGAKVVDGDIVVSVKSQGFMLIVK